MNKSIHKCGMEIKFLREKRDTLNVLVEDTTSGAITQLE